jgi:hypothetical protein
MRMKCLLNGSSLIVLCMAAFHGSSASAKDGMQWGLRFDSPGVLDLAERTQQIAGATAAVTALAPAEAGKILAAPTLSEEQPSLPFSDDVYGCKKPSKTCSAEHEGKLIGASNGAIKRDGKRLTIVPVSAAPAIFFDWKVPTTKTADGDEETHWYLGRLDGNGYHRVEVQFGQDAPGSFLINPQSGKIAFVHNGSDVVVPSADAAHLLTFNSLNTPLSIRVAALDAAGPSLDLQCEVGKDNDRVTGQFKGWHDASSFDLVLQIPAVNSGPVRVIATRLTQHDGAWGIAASDSERLAGIGFACHSTAAARR